MNWRKWITENTIMLCLLLIAIGFILIFIAQYLGTSIWRKVIESFGVLFTSIFFASLLYEKFLAEKHSEEFSLTLDSKLKQMDSIQSTCMRLGIHEILETRNDFERKYPLFNLFSRVKPRGRIFVIGRSMFFFFNRGDAIKKALREGSNMQIACISPNKIDKVLSEVCFLRRADIESSLEGVNDLVNWMEKEKPPGSFELKIHDAPFPDSILYIELRDKKLIAWDLTFGRDTDQKRVFVIEPCEANVGNDLLRRYESVWKLGKVYVKVECNGKVDDNKLHELIKMNNVENRPGVKPQGQNKNGI